MEHSIAQVNVDALRHNLERAKSFADPNAKCLAMIKTNAYGHGLTPVAHALTNADAFGVARLDAAVKLRESGIKKRIVLMTGFMTKEALDTILQYKLDVVVHQALQLDILDAYLPQEKHQLAVWLKVNAGMNRLGFELDAAEETYQRLVHCPLVAGSPIIISHFPGAEVDTDEARALTKIQFEKVSALSLAHNAPLSISHSAGLLAGYGPKTDWIRPGIMLYGVTPRSNRVGADEGLKPAMTLTSRLIAVRQLKKGDAVGYGGTWVAPEAMPIGVVAIGYGDGYPRHALSGTPILVEGVKCALVGRVSMDMLMIDLRACPQAKVGDQVTLWGEKLPVELIAKRAGSIPYELLAGMTNRVCLKYE